MDHPRHQRTRTKPSSSASAPEHIVAPADHADHAVVNAHHKTSQSSEPALRRRPPVGKSVFKAEMAGELLPGASSWVYPVHRHGRQRIRADGFVAMGRRRVVPRTTGDLTRRRPGLRIPDGPYAAT
jgi:hypothetical protein